MGSIHLYYVAQFYEGLHCVDNTLLGITIYPQGILQFLVVYLLQNQLGLNTK